MTVMKSMFEHLRLLTLLVLGVCALSVSLPVFYSQTSGEESSPTEPKEDTEPEEGKEGDEEHEEGEEHEKD